MEPLTSAGLTADLKRALSLLPPPPARGFLYGMPIIENPYLPEIEDELIGHWITWHHPMVRWASRYLRIRPYDVWPMKRSGRVAFFIGSGLVMNPRNAVMLTNFTAA